MRFSIFFCGVLAGMILLIFGIVILMVGFNLYARITSIEAGYEEVVAVYVKDQKTIHKHWPELEKSIAGFVALHRSHEMRLDRIEDWLTKNTGGTPESDLRGPTLFALPKDAPY